MDRGHQVVWITLHCGKQKQHRGYVLEVAYNVRVPRAIVECECGAVHRVPLTWLMQERNIGQQPARG